MKTQNQNKEQKTASIKIRVTPDLKESLLNKVPNISEETRTHWKKLIKDS